MPPSLTPAAASSVAAASTPIASTSSRWLPCGLVYSLVVTALASGSGSQGALTLLVFGLGTLPNVWLIGSTARWSVWRRPAMRRAAGLLISAWAGWAVLQHLRLV